MAQQHSCMPLCRLAARMIEQLMLWHLASLHTPSQEISWGNLMSLVGDDVNGEGKAWAKERAGIKERWRDINAAITELRDTQCSWTIPDASLRANMKDAIAEDFVPLYKV